ncbi:MAG: S1C family serine protease [Pirellulaceae bacterium]
MLRHLFILGTTCALVGVTLGSLLHPVSSPIDLSAQEPAKAAAAKTIAASTDDSSEFTLDEQRSIRVYEAVNRSVVNITTRAVRTDMMYTDILPTEGSGSGSILDKEGHILTNFHVVEGAQQIQVTLANGNSFTAGLVGQDPSNDMAVLQIEAPPGDLTPVTLGDSSRLRVGQRIYAIGNPFGLERTMTVGIVSSLNRTLMSRNQRTIKSIIQIDAALNRGNSGGPLLNSKGQLVGMNTAIASSTGENTGVGFSIPVNTIKRVVPQLIEKGHVTRPDLGLARVFQTDDGLLIAATTPDGPADQAGLQGFRLVREQSRRGPYLVERTRIDQSQADLITAIDGQRVKTVDDLLTLIEEKQPGDRVRVRIVRQGQQEEVAVTLGVSE